MNEQRNASDVILDIENYVKEILAYIKNQDMTIKIMANRLSKLEGTSSGFVPNSSQTSAPTDSPQKPSQMPGIKPGVKIGKGGPAPDFVASPSELRTEFDDDGNEQIEVDIKPVGNRRGSRTKKKISKGVPVQQKILYPDGKNVCLANVEIFKAESNGQLKSIKTCRTNSAGKWNVLLSDGQYLVSISKVGTSTKPTVEASYQIEVPAIDKPLELDPYQS